MSVRYTAANRMEQTALRPGEMEVDRWRDKIELRLDNRQVFFLFFGSAVVACMLFVLGVMVGKRIESRGAAAAPEVQDPLAVLDRARQPTPSAAVTDEELTFPSTLIAGAQKARPPAAKVAAAAAPPKPLPPKPAAALVAVAPKPAAPVVATTPKPATALVATAPKPVLPVVATAPKPAAPLMPATKPPGLPAAPKPLGAVTTPAPAPADPAKARGKFTLQLSTFATQEDAESFARKYPGAFVIAGDVSGRGMAYRVRLGNYGSFKDAAAAKESFERQHKMIALVAAR